MNDQNGHDIEDLQPLATAVRRHELIDTRRAIAIFGPVIAREIHCDRNQRIAQAQVHGLVFLVRRP